MSAFDELAGKDVALLTDHEEKTVPVFALEEALRVADRLCGALVRIANAEDDPVAIAQAALSHAEMDW